MKDLTHYFVSPTKNNVSPSETIEIIDSAKREPELHNKVIKDDIDNNKVLENIENNEQKDKTKRKRGRKKKVRKVSDPVVKNITELLSNGLTLISPNTSFSETIVNNTEKTNDIKPNIKRKSLEKQIMTEISKNKNSNKRKSQEKSILIDDENTNNITDDATDNLKQCTGMKNGSNKKFDEVEFQENQSCSSSNLELSTEGTPKTQKNAFEFMMHARNRSIGQNSPGKEKEEEISPNSKEKKDLLKIRRNFLEEWSEKKGAGKRKREEEDKEIQVNQKMNKRAKRLKNLLQLDKSTDKMEKKKLRRINSESDCIELESSTNDSLNVSANGNKTDKVCDKGNNKLLNFLGVFKKADKTDTVNAVTNEKCEYIKKETIKIKMFGSPKVSRKNKKSRLSLKKTDSLDLDLSTTEEPNKNKLINGIKSEDDLLETVINKKIIPRKQKPQLLKSSDEETSDDNEALQKKAGKREDDQEKTFKKDTNKNKSPSIDLKSDDNLEGSPKSKIKQRKRRSQVLKFSDEESSNDNGRLQTQANNGSDINLSMAENKNKPIKGNASLSIALNSENDQEKTSKNKKIKSIKRNFQVETSSKKEVSNDSEKPQTKANNGSVVDLSAVKQNKNKTLPRNTSPVINLKSEDDQEGPSKSNSKLRKRRPQILQSSDETSNDTEGPQNKAGKRKPECISNGDQNKKTGQRNSGKVNKTISKQVEQNKTENSDEIASKNVSRPRRNQTRLQYHDESSLDSLPSIPRRSRTRKLSSDDDLKSNIQVLRLRKIREATPESDEEWKVEPSVVKKAPAKIAPVFLKAVPKPKEDPEVVEARRQFLMSGIPSSLKKTMEKQQSLIEKEVELFPEIQHVIQKCGSQYWKLSKPNLILRDLSPLKQVSTLSCRDLNSKVSSRPKIPVPKTEKITKYKSYIDDIKTQNPNYPVYKAFKQIFEKSGYKVETNEEIPKERKRGRKKRRSKKSLDCSVEIIENTPIKLDPIKFSMWTEKYKPKSSNDIIGNSNSITALKLFLKTWTQISRGILSKKKCKQSEYTSESEFEVTDSDSRDSTKLPGNVVILNGPPGSGKTTAIYAICEELGLKVLELNASSKRTGKRLLQEMQEATQSHQVRKNHPGEMQNFIKAVNVKEAVKEVNSENNTKMCVILIEDVDIVFEQDETFISALSQLITTTKRPIILTTTDISSVNVQKFSNFETLNFAPLSSSTLATWLRLVCLVEGFLVDQDMLGMLLEHNRGDPRRTLLQLQFWLQSGGQYYQCDNKKLFKINNRRSNEIHLQDDSSNLSFIEDTNTKEVFTHSLLQHLDVNCCEISSQLSLGTIWWNIPNLLSLPQNDEHRLNKFSELKWDVTEYNSIVPDKLRLNSEEIKKLKQFAELHDCLAFVDEVKVKLDYVNDIEPCVRNKTNLLKDSLEFEDVLIDYRNYDDLNSDICNTLFNNNIHQFLPSNDDRYNFNMAVPVASERRWRAKQHVCEDILQEATPNNLSKSQLYLDYLPSLRNIARNELNRSINNTKRGNRFRHYLKSVGISFNESSSKLACNVFSWD